MAIVRLAEDRDFEAVARLLEELGRGALTAETEGVYRERFWRHVRRPDAASLVAEVDGQVVGFVSLELRERLSRAQREAWIPDFIVAEAQRGHGLGRALLRRAFELAREAGCYRVTLETGYSRKVAQQLYRAMSMSDRGLYMELDF